MRFHDKKKKKKPDKILVHDILVVLLRNKHLGSCYLKRFILLYNMDKHIITV